MGWDQWINPMDGRVLGKVQIDITITDTDLISSYRITKDMWKKGEEYRRQTIRQVRRPGVVAE